MDQLDPRVAALIKTASSIQFSSMHELVDRLRMARDTGNVRGMSQHDLMGELDKSRRGTFVKVAAAKDDKVHERMVAGGALGSLAGVAHGLHTGRDPVLSALLLGIMGGGIGHAVGKTEQAVKRHKRAEELQKSALRAAAIDLDPPPAKIPTNEAIGAMVEPGALSALLAPGKERKAAEMAEALAKMRRAGPGAVAELLKRAK